MATIRLKGGVGSGFYDHEGRPGKVGGSVAASLGSYKIYTDYTDADKAARSLVIPDPALRSGKRKYDGQWAGFVLPDDSGMIVSIDHQYIVQGEDTEEHVKEVLGTSKIEALDHGAIALRVVPRSDTNGMVFILSKTVDSSALRRLQSLIDSRKIPYYPEGKYIWEDLSQYQNTDYVNRTPPVSGSLEDILGAKHVVNYELKEDNSVVVTKGGKGSGYREHPGRPGKVGGSSPRRYIGAKPLDEYMKLVESFPWTTQESWSGYEKSSFQYRKVPYPYPDYSVLQGLENTSRNCQRDYEMDFDTYVKTSEEKFQKQLAESGVFMRITAENLEEALDEEQFENTFTAKKTGARGYLEQKRSYKSYLRNRKEGEAEALGVPTDAPPEDRPIYGYWSKGNGFGENFEPWLGQYGEIAIEFDRDKIADELTFTDSDSLDLSDRVRSSDWRHPSILSSYGITNSSYVPDIADRGPDDAMFWEAQIYNKSISNIKSVKSRKPLPQSLIDKLEKAGIQWQIVL